MTYNVALKKIFRVNLLLFLTSASEPKLMSVAACLGWCLLPDRIVNLITSIPVYYLGDSSSIEKHWINHSFTRRIDACVECVPGFEQTQVLAPDDISCPVSPGVVQPCGRGQLEADLQGRPRRPLVQECHRHRGPATKNRHNWSEKNTPYIKEIKDKALIT